MYAISTRPSRHRLARLAVIGLLSLLCGSFGCSFTNLMTAIASTTTSTLETVPPEFSRLPGHTVLVYVWSPAEIRWAYPKVRLDLSAYLCEYLEQNVENITVVDYWQVESFFEQRSTYQLREVEQMLAREFNADMVIHLSVYKLSMRDPGFGQFYRGRLAASVVVHDFTRLDAPERIPLQDVEVANPEPSERPIGIANASPTEIRRATYDRFTVKVGRKFHEYQRDSDMPDD